MSVSRRKFIKAGTLVALTAAIPFNIFGQNRKEKDGNPVDQLSQSDPLQHYNQAAFTSYLNSIFQLQTGYSVINVTLTEVKDLLPAGTQAASGRECFSLLFRGGTVALRQSTYQITHPALGRFELFLVPGGPDDTGAQSFVAIINRTAYDPTAVPQSRTYKSLERTSTPTPSPQTAPVAAPATSAPATTTTPAEKAKPARKRIPSWKEIEEDID
jgi:hypothetical protein